MANDARPRGPQRAPKGPGESEPETLVNHVIDDSEVEDDLDDLLSIDQLLAETDQGWDIEQQVLTLQQAAATVPIAEKSGAGQRPRLPTLPLQLPTASELAPTLIPATTKTGQVPEAPVTPEPPKGKSKFPPPLPRKGAPPSSGPSRTVEPSPTRMPSDMAQPDALVDLLQARIATLESSEDKVSLARAHIELAIASEAILGDDVRATQHAETALRVDPTSSAAHAMLRRKRHSRAALPVMLGHLEHELRAATSEPHKVELLVEKARLLDAVGDRGPEARAVWEQALTHAPQHAAALKGLEVELVARALSTDAPSDWDALAVHLARMADAYGSEPRLAAWLHVERAQILERRLGRLDAARGALERALELDGGVGPVRAALVRHVAAHGDWPVLAKLLADEAGLETSSLRAARLELDAAMIFASRLGEPARACALLESAAQRAPTVPAIDRRVLDELVRLHEADSRWADAARARRTRIRFVTDPATIAYELRALAANAEREGDVETAIADVQRAIAVDATDPTLVETLDRLYARTDKHDQRIATWLQEAARTEDGVKRSKALARAAKICDEAGRPPDALRHLRSAWVAAPGDPEVLDAFARLLAPVLTESVDQGARSLVELYAQAAEQAHDADRRVAYLEKVALLWEEVLGDPGRAAHAYEQVLEIDSGRRSAMLGLQRAAARMGDARMLARALLSEARIAGNGLTRLELRTRAAGALAKHDPARAMQLVREVLLEEPRHADARALETRLEEDAGRWELAGRSMQARVDGAATTAEKVSLWLALAQLQHERLRDGQAAMRSLEQARALDPTHPVPPEEIARVLESYGDSRALRDALERLAGGASSQEERVRHLTRAAEIDELRLGDDGAASRTYQRALAESPEDELVAERLTLVLARRGLQPGGSGLGELASLLARRMDRAPSPVAARVLGFQLAALLVEIDKEATRATTLLESTIAEQSDHVPGLRTLEWVRRKASEVAPLSRVLSKQGEELKDVRARLGALWNLAALEEWRLPLGDPSATYKQILELDPTDPGALEAALRRDLPTARRGDPRARKMAMAALRTLVPFASDDDTRLALQLRLALLLETAAEESNEPRAGTELAREALDRYRDALRIDELSVSASTGVARLAGRLADSEAALAAARSLAELALEPRVRARYLVDASELLLGPDEDPRLGTPEERQRQAGSMLERALDADPDSISAAGRLATVLLEGGLGERLVAAFRAALGKARSPDATVMLGSEIARVARDDLHDLTIAIDAMRKVRASAPQHVPSLLMLSELCIAQRSWPEAVDALEAVVSTSREVPHKLTALFALASIYEKVLAKPEDMERVLRAALAIDPNNARALRALLRRLTSDPVGDDAAQKSRRTEVAELLSRLARVERDPDQRSTILLELADVHGRLGDAKSAEHSLVEAVATAPNNARAFARLAGLYRKPKGRDDVGHARALSAVIAMGQELGTVDARWFAALGQLEIQALSRMRDGIAHLQRAVALEPALHETRFELASAFERMGAHDEATKAMLALLSPSAEPLLSISDPAAGLALLERSLVGERRTDEAVVVSELRALAGELEEARRSWLRARRPAPIDSTHAPLDRPALVTHVLPAEGRHILLEVAAAIGGIEAKLLRADLSEAGISTRDRLTSRSGHPLRLLLDRVARQVGLGDIELAISKSVNRTRVLAQDVPWIVVPPALVEQSEMAQAASLARAAARIVFGVPWLEELPAAQIEALLVAAARQVVPGYGGEDVDVLASKLVAQHEQSVARALARRQRKLLEELAPHIASPQTRHVAIDAFVAALTRGELRAAFVLTGDLLAVVDEIRTLDPALGAAVGAPGPQALAAVLSHNYASDVVRYALTAEATGLRRRLGTIWKA